MASLKTDGLLLRSLSGVALPQSQERLGLLHSSEDLALCLFGGIAQETAHKHEDLRFSLMLMWSFGSLAYPSLGVTYVRPVRQILSRVGDKQSCKGE